MPTTRTQIGAGCSAVCCSIRVTTGGSFSFIPLLLLCGDDGVDVEDSAFIDDAADDDDGVQPSSFIVMSC
jgi:hypothetical protein